jgi:phosphate transport system protein
MALHLERQATRLKKQVLALGAMVEEVVRDAITAIDTRDADLAKRVISADAQIDRAEIDMEEECLHTLALHQPVAFDLRYVVAILKINNELERIGDLAVNIAEQALFLAAQPPVTPMPLRFADMQERVQVMLHGALDALVSIAPDEARAVRLMDAQLDEMHKRTYAQVEERIRQNPADAERIIHFLNVSRQLERIGDHAVNIAEDVVYMAEGELLRHSRKSPSAPKA